MSDRSDLTRRKALAALGGVGVASLGAGYWTSAFLSDTERFGDNRLVTGNLDVKVGFAVHYASRTTVEDYEGVTRDRTANGFPVTFDSASVRETFMTETLETQMPQGGLSTDDDPCEALVDGTDTNRLLFDAGDCKPGDFGLVDFDFSLCSNPGYAWLVGSLEDAADARQTEAELDATAEEDGVVELLDGARATVWPGGADAVLEGTLEPVYYGTLRGALSTLERGVLVDGDAATEATECCPAAPAVHSVCLLWELPLAAGNEHQVDTVNFDLGLYVEQCRHNSPEDATVARATTDGIDRLVFGVLESRNVDLEAIDPDVTVTETAEDGAPAGVDWTTGVSADVVVAEHDGVLENFEGGSSGSVIVSEGVPSGDDQTLDAPLPEDHEGVTLTDSDDGFA